MNAAPENPPVSVKAALRSGDKWILLRNDRGEWELPGGRVDVKDASLEDVVRRECREELGINIEVGNLLTAYLFEVIAGHRVTIICFAATTEDVQFTVSDEHDAVAAFTSDQLDALVLPEGYRNAIALAECTG